ncbi:hypothetical protein C357_04040 [Citreicella sp. 357]|nr:hypothetical protein C357_04040 [Citreicella sp. 357]
MVIQAMENRETSSERLRERPIAWRAKTCQLTRTDMTGIGPSRTRPTSQLMPSTARTAMRGASCILKPRNHSGGPGTRLPRRRGRPVGGRLERHRRIDQVGAGLQHADSVERLRPRGQADLEGAGFPCSAGARQKRCGRRKRDVLMTGGLAIPSVEGMISLYAEQGPVCR